MNQLCVSYLNKGLAESTLFLGKEKFNRQLEDLAPIFVFDPEKAFSDLESMYEKISSMEPQIVYQVSRLLCEFEKENLPCGQELYNQIINKYSELEAVFPIYCGWYTQGDIVAVLKMPHLKLTVLPLDECTAVSFQKLEKLLTENIISATVSQMASNAITSRQDSQLVIHFHCLFSELKFTIESAIEVLKNEFGTSIRITIVPVGLERPLREELYNKNLITIEKIEKNLKIRTALE